MAVAYGSLKLLLRKSKVLPIGDGRVDCNMLLHGVATEITAAVWGGTTLCTFDVRVRVRVRVRWV